MVENEKKIKILIGIYKRRLKRLKLDPAMSYCCKDYAEGQLVEFIDSLNSLALVIK